MSTMVCGKRSFFDDMDTGGTSPTSSSPPAYKKFRCSSSSTSPVRFSYSLPTAVDQLKALFPDMEIQLLEKALNDSGNDLESAIKSLHRGYGHGQGNLDPTAEETSHMEKVAAPTGGETGALKDPLVPNNLPADGAEWLDLFVKEMTNATSIDDARSRAASILENLEISIRSRVSAEATQSLQKENAMLKEQIEVLLRDNVILKRAVAIQHERQREYDEKNQEVQQLKQMLAQYQEQLRTLEVNNYALSMHLRQAQQNSSLPGHFHPDIF